MLFKVIYTNRMFVLSFCRGIPSMKLGELPNPWVAHALELWGTFLSVLVLKHISKPGSVEQKMIEREGKEAFQGQWPQMKGLLLMSECLLPVIFKFIVMFLLVHQVFFSDTLNFPWLTLRGNLQVGLMWKIKTALRLSLKCSATN